MTERRRDRDRDPAPLGDLLKTLVAGRGWREHITLERLREAWPEIVGPTVATRSEPVRLQGGVLQVRAEGGAWATELTLLSSTIASKADEFLGGGAVSEVRVNASTDRPTDPRRRPR